MPRHTNPQDRRRSDFRKTFGTASGKNVLTYLYGALFGKQPTVPLDGNPYITARNEGMRDAFLLIMEQLREEDMEMRKYYEDYLAENRREEMNQ